MNRPAAASGPSTAPSAAAGIRSPGALTEARLWSPTAGAAAEAVTGIPTANAMPACATTVSMWGKADVNEPMMCRARLTVLTPAASSKEFTR